MNRNAKPVFHCEIPRLVHNQFCAWRHELGLQIAPEEREGLMPASCDTRVMLKMSLFDIATIPVLTPPIAEDLAVPLLILGNRETRDQQVAEAVARKLDLEGFQDVGCRLDLRNLRGGLPKFKD